MDTVTTAWLRAQGDRCALHAAQHVSAGEHDLGEAGEKYARLARDWFAAAAQAYYAANELQGPVQ